MFLSDVVRREQHQSIRDSRRTMASPSIRGFTSPDNYSILTSRTPLLRPCSVILPPSMPGGNLDRVPDPEQRGRSAPRDANVREWSPKRVSLLTGWSGRVYTRLRTRYVLSSMDLFHPRPVRDRRHGTIIIRPPHPWPVPRPVRGCPASL
ncbi:hypothetical protein BO78DRAFT_19332 [Aspergillus sclerotiicarbonarius CBS 121057]|uniref:Uncharacterized protein n=1 Tax=Aspergillus sclerotiicarbonarius (strain CBS 121057 / IBT 28362) TaxID=1448318 RepID=A0A319EBY2_ASPSB|nr:hypothetical protein BO78DRAFT_19332 [Aspergillus sclerotiicarbonarius CBS 121057]